MGANRISAACNPFANRAVLSFLNSVETVAFFPGKNLSLFSSGISFLLNFYGIQLLISVIVCPLQGKFYCQSFCCHLIDEDAGRRLDRALKGTAVDTVIRCYIRLSSKRPVRRGKRIPCCFVNKGKDQGVFFGPEP